MRILLIALVAFLLGADGGTVGPRRVGTKYDVTGRYLCDNKVAADAGGNCTLLRDSPEVPEYYHFSITESVGCGTISLNVQTLFQTDSDAYTVCTLTDTDPDCFWDVNEYGPLQAFFQVAITTADTCTELDVVAEFYTLK